MVTAATRDGEGVWMAYLVEVPVDGGGRLVVRVDEDDLPGGLTLASLRPGQIVARGRGVA
jgi:hypothetical protein